MKQMLFLLSLLASFFTALAQPPTITSFSPTSGPVGTIVTITGTNFSANPTDNIVYFGAVKATVVSATTTSLTVTAPAGATYKPVSVTTSKLVAYAGKPFIVTSVDNCDRFSANSFEKIDSFRASGSIDIGDFDGDGKSDLIIEKSGILRNTGSSWNIAFTPENRLEWDYPFKNIAIGDVDGDGKLDVVATTNERSRVAIFKNTSTIGIISFTKVAEYLIPTYNFRVYSGGGVVIGDLDVDGKPDLIVSSADHSLPNYDIVTIFKNTSTTGTISFETGDSYSAGSNLQDIQLGDLNVDGKPDLVLREIRPNKVSVFKNTSSAGTIKFDAPLDFPVLATTLLRLPPDPLRHTIGDIDGDGEPDLVLGNGILRNVSSNGTIAFALQISYPEGDLPAIGDLDGDGNPDIALDNGILQNLSTSGVIAFAQKVNFFTLMKLPSPIVDRGHLMGLAIGDLNGDGKPDIAAQPKIGSINDTERVFIFRNVMPIGCGSSDRPTFLNNEQIVLQLSCAGNDGLISIIPTSGVPPFQYSIYGGSTYVNGPDQGYTFTNLTQGTYYLRLKDSQGLESEEIVKEIWPAPTFHLDHFTTTSASCGASNGTIDIVTKCGDAPYHLRIRGRSDEIESETGIFHLTQLPAGLYTISITDAVGTPILGPSPLQVGSFEVTVNAENCPGTCVNPPTFLNNPQIVLDASCNRSDGQISIIPTSGTAPFMYSINGGTAYVQGLNVGHTFTNLAPGVYRLRMKESNGCESEIVSKVVGHLPGCPSGQNTLTGPSQRNGEKTLSITVPAAQVITYPNPSHGRFWIQFKLFGAEKAQLQILDSRGAVVQTRTVNAQQTTTVDINLSGKAKGLYLIRVVSDKGVQTTKVQVQ
jgi:hypothetical protein